jgi:pimeloyl-ACP methyl ester carboxylesterase
MAVTEMRAARVEETVDVGGGMRICFSTEGDPSDPALVLIPGLGQQLNVWPAAFREGLRCDNRDVGRSGRATCPPPTGPQFLTRRFSTAQYDLGAMTADTVGLLDALGIERAHLVGMSMGGMIGQGVAARHPERVVSLTSIMSMTGAPRTGRPALSTWMRLALPPARTKEAHADRVVAMMRHISSRGYPFEEDAVRSMALEGWDRSGGTGADGVARQLAAIMRSGDRTAEVARITAPTLAIHGDRDLMVNPSGGRATAATIPGARHLAMSGMGHDLPAGACPTLIEEIASHAARAAARP